MTSRLDFSQRNVPRTTQCSDLSDLQRMVKKAKLTILDPVLAQFSPDGDYDDENPAIDIPIEVECLEMPLPSAAQPTPPPSILPPEMKPSRTRRPTHKLKSGMSRNGRRQSKQMVKADLDPEPPPPPQPDPLLTKRRKPKPETYKLAWSLDEQHLLEQLLHDIPEGEKNRQVVHHCVLLISD
jgi:hypothetical protein